MFPAVVLKYKVVAPGAKTFAQVMYARFGKLPHVILCCASITFNVFVVASLMACKSNEYSIYFINVIFLINGALF